MLNEYDPEVIKHLSDQQQSDLRDALNRLERGQPILRPDQAQLPAEPKGKAIANLIDHTLLLAQYTPEDVDRACEEALTYGFASVCVNPIYIPQVAQRLDGSAVKPASVVGFIFGADFPAIKIAQAKQLIDAGVVELDGVLAVGLLKVRQYLEVGQDLFDLVQVCHKAGVLMKVILETGLLSKDEIISGVILAKHVGADYVKTCTGFAPGEAKVEDIELMRRLAGHTMGVKAAAGVRSYEKAIALVRAGASRIGATQSVKITEEAP